MYRSSSYFLGRVFIIFSIVVLGSFKAFAADFNDLGTLKLLSATNGWGPLEFNLSNGENKKGDGKKISIAGTSCPIGLGMHARADIQFALPKNAALFRAGYGIDDAVRPRGGVDLVIYGDGKQLFHSGIITGKTEYRAFDIDIRGVKTLRIYATNGSDGNDYDWLSFCKPQIISNTNAPASDLAYPVISTVKVDSVESSAARISWTTDKLSFGRVQYGTTDKLGGSSSYTSAALKSSSAVISNLKPNTTYFYRVLARDVYGRGKVSKIQQLKTPVYKGIVSEVSAPSTCPAKVTATVSAGQSIQSAFNTAQPGSVIKVKNGVYKGALQLDRSGTASAPILICAETPGQVFIEDNAARGVNKNLVSGSGQYINLRGLTVRKFKNRGYQNDTAAINTNSHWTLESITAEYNDSAGIGVIGQFVTLRNIVSRYNGSNGIGSSAAQDVDFQGGEIYSNNRGVADPIWKDWKGGDGKPLAVNIGGNIYVLKPGNEGGGGKWAETQRVKIRNLRTHDNGGPGIWFDINNKDYDIQLVESYKNVSPYNADGWVGVGIAIELGYGGNVSHNFVHDNTGSGIAIWEVENAVVTNNKFLNDGLELGAMNRHTKMINLVATNNKFVNGNAGITRTGGTVANLKFSSNSYSNAGDRDIVKNRFGETNGVIDTTPIVP